LRAAQLEDLIGALEIKFAGLTRLRPCSGDGTFCGAQNAIVGALDGRNFKVNGIFFLRDLCRGQTGDALIDIVESGDELLFVVVGDVQLQPDAHAFGFQRALPDTLGAGNGIRRPAPLCDQSPSMVWCAADIFPL
jgi:hypothetical protein